jgi:hypothetical protein
LKRAAPIRCSDPAATLWPASAPREARAYLICSTVINRNRTGSRATTYRNRSRATTYRQMTLRKRHQRHRLDLPPLRTGPQSASLRRFFFELKR